MTTGPINPGTHFPNYYTDQTGSSLQLCITGTAVCPALPPGGLVPPNGEAFYFLATAEIPVPAGVVSVTFALEAAFLSADGNSQLVFDRLRVRGPAPAGSYTLEHPYGETTLTSSGNLPTGINFTDDVGCADVPCNFDTAKGGRLTDFLRATGLVTPGFLGDSATRSTVTGATATDGGVPRNLVRLRNSSGVVLGQTNLFIVTGQLVNGPAAGLAESQVEFGNTAAADRSIAITNIGTAALSLGVPSVGGPYSVTAQTCSAGPIAIGATCSVTVHYASVGANANAAATLVMPANTTAGTVSIPLHATSLPVATVTGGPLESAGSVSGTSAEPARSR